jgi:hypothetical protein
MPSASLVVLKLGVQIVTKNRLALFGKIRPFFERFRSSEKSEAKQKLLKVEVWIVFFDHENWDSGGVLFFSVFDPITISSMPDVP